MISDTRSTWGWSINRRSTRRWIVIVYWLVAMFFACEFFPYILRHNGNFFSSGLFNILVFFPALLGGIRTGGAIKPFHGVWWPTGPDREEMVSLFHVEKSALAEDSVLDERETRLRDRVHFISYTVTRWLALVLFLLDGLIGMMHTEWLAVSSPMFFFLLVLTLWSLPQSIILWNEPDVVEAEA